MPIKPKKKVCAKCEKLTYIFGRKMCNPCYHMDLAERNKDKPRTRSSIKRVKRKKPISKKAKKRGVKSKSVASLKKKLWIIFSKYVRLRDSDIDGYTKCITCDKVLFWKELQGGHFIVQHGNPNTWINEKNVHAQCGQCNVYKHGEQYIYGKAVDNLYGEGTAEELLRLSKIYKEFHIDELEELIVLYTSKLNKLLKDRNLRL